MKYLISKSKSKLLRITESWTRSCNDMWSKLDQWNLTEYEALVRPRVLEVRHPQERRWLILLARYDVGWEMEIEGQNLAKKSIEGRYPTKWQQKQSLSKTIGSNSFKGGTRKSSKTSSLSKRVRSSSRTRPKLRQRVQRLSRAIASRLVKSLRRRSNWPTEEHKRPKYRSCSLRSDSRAAGEMENCAVAGWRRISSTIEDNSATRNSNRSMSIRIVLGAEIAKPQESAQL